MCRNIYIFYRFYREEKTHTKRYTKGKGFCDKEK